MRWADSFMNMDPQVSNERLAVIAISGTSAQAWEARLIAAECLAHRIASGAAGSRKSQAPQVVGLDPKDPQP